MPVHVPAVQPRPRRGWDGPWLTTIALTALMAMMTWVVAAAAPKPLLLPILSVALTALAGAVALVAWRLRQPRRADRLGYWDLAGALTLFGIVAALFSDPAEVIPLLEARRAP